MKTLLDCARIATKNQDYQLREDLQQELCLHILEKGCEDKPPAYIIRAMKNKMIDMSRKASRWTLPEFNTVDKLTMLAAQVAERKYSMFPELNFIDQYDEFIFCENMTPRERCLLMWSNQFSENQVSETLGLPYKWVVKTVKRLRRRVCC